MITNAHRINAGQPPLTHGLADFFLFPRRTPSRSPTWWWTSWPTAFPVASASTLRDVQVLCPMHRGPAGAGVLNERLQGALTPAREGLGERRFGGRVYRVGDKVMQLRNNYDKGSAGVFNGSVGVVTALSLEDQELRVLLDEDEEVGYGFDELDELTHAYAVSIHRSQGSEYPCVVVALTMSAWLMLQRQPALHRRPPEPNSSWCWSVADARWPRPSAPRAPAAATPPSPNGSSQNQDEQAQGDPSEAPGFGDRISRRRQRAELGHQLPAQARPFIAWLGSRRSGQGSTL